MGTSKTLGNAYACWNCNEVISNLATDCIYCGAPQWEPGDDPEGATQYGDDIKHLAKVKLRREKINRKKG